MGCGELTSISPAPLLEAQRADRPSPRKRQCKDVVQTVLVLGHSSNMSELTCWWKCLHCRVTVTCGKGNGIHGSSRSGHHSFKREATWRQPQRIWPSDCWWGIAAILVAAHGDLWLFVSWDYYLNFEFRGAYELIDTYVHWALQASWMHDCSGTVESKCGASNSLPLRGPGRFACGHYQLEAWSCKKIGGSQR